MGRWRLGNGVTKLFRKEWREGKNRYMRGEEQVKNVSSLGGGREGEIVEG